MIEPFEVLLLLLHNKEPQFKVNLWPCVHIPPKGLKTTCNFSMIFSFNGHLLFLLQKRIEFAQTTKCNFVLDEGTNFKIELVNRISPLRIENQVLSWLIQEFFFKKSCNFSLWLELSYYFALADAWQHISFCQDDAIIVCPVLWGLLCKRFRSIPDEGFEAWNTDHYCHRAIYSSHFWRISGNCL